VHASTVVALSEEELVSRSDIIVMGTVVHTSVKVKNGSEIVTHAVLQVYQRLLGGEATRFITIEVPGGILPNGLRSVTSGAPKLVLGDMVLGYLERHGDVFWPLGLSYGLLRVWLNAEGKATVVRQLDGLYLLRPEPISGSVNLLRTPEPLNVYIQRIAHLVGQPALPWGGEVQKW
tara:strand:+ start:165 stop:692 length:528 start_codon:yes stop_codon:yes gene_type:complete